MPNDWGKMHHAYLISRSTATAGNIWLELEKLEFIRQANPDALHLELENLGIEEARDLTAWALKKAFGARKVAVITTGSITSEAQNALLKLFEEPPENTYFFVSLANLGGVLPTLLSRVQTLELGDQEIEEDLSSKFIKSDLSGRYKIINTIIKNKDKEKAKILISQISNTVKERRNKEEMEMILKSEKFLQGRSGSLKMILENVAINL
jgi:DNA polymerase III delta prime subunit